MSTGSDLDISLPQRTYYTAEQVIASNAMVSVDQCLRRCATRSAYFQTRRGPKLRACSGRGREALRRAAEKPGLCSDLRTTKKLRSALDCHRILKVHYVHNGAALIPNVDMVP